MGFCSLICQNAAEKQHNMKQTVIATISLIAFMIVPSQSHCAGAQGRVDVYLTARDTGQRLAKSETIGFTEKISPTEKDEEIFVDPSKKFQTILGIGGALTDASAETFYKLPKDKQQEILKAYYDLRLASAIPWDALPSTAATFQVKVTLMWTMVIRHLKSFSIAHDLKLSRSVHQTGSGGYRNKFHTLHQPLESARVDEGQ